MWGAGGVGWGNNSDTEAPLSGADGVIFNKACALEPKGLRLSLTPDSGFS